MKNNTINLFSMDNVSADDLQKISFRSIFDCMFENKSEFNGIIITGLLHKKYLTAFKELELDKPAEDVSIQQRQFRKNHLEIGMKLICAEHEYDMALRTKDEDRRQESLKQLKELMQPFFEGNILDIGNSQDIELLPS